jgi:protein-tyrosine phosphatase
LEERMSGAGVTGPLTDLHSHLVPGVDDGAPSLDDALEGIERMVAQGFGAAVTTPHLNAELTRDPEGFSEFLAQVDVSFEELRLAVERRFPGFVLRRGHEVRLDRPDPDLSDARVRLGGSDAVLVEWPAFQIPPGTTPVLKGLLARGIRPVLAHPERYRGYDPGLGLVAEWHEAGALLQLTFGSLVGRYGAAVTATAFRLLELGFADCLSSDFHGRPHLALHVAETRELFEVADAAAAWEILTMENPRRILSGEDVLAVPPLALGSRGLVERIRSFFHR